MDTTTDIATNKDYLEGVIDRASFGEDVEKTRTVRFVISTSARDRHRTVVNMKNWKLDNFNRNPIVGYQHNVYGDNMCTGPNPDDVLGPARAWIETKDGKDILMGEVTFETADINPQAEKIFRKVLNGTLRATSVGFLEVGRGKYGEGEERAGGKNETYYFEGQELIEFSIVNIPSNPEATRKVIVNHARAGVTMLNRIGLPVSEIRRVVNDILDSIEKQGKPEEKSGADPNLNKYLEQLRKHKQ